MRLYDRVCLGSQSRVARSQKRSDTTPAIIDTNNTICGNSREICKTVGIGDSTLCEMKNVAPPYLTPTTNVSVSSLFCLTDSQSTGRLSLFNLRHRPRPLPHSKLPLCSTQLSLARNSSHSRYCEDNLRVSTSPAHSSLLKGAYILCLSILPKPTHDPSKRVPPLPHSLFSWPLAIWYSDLEIVRVQNGLDAYMFLRFLRSEYESLSILLFLTPL